MIDRYVALTPWSTSARWDMRRGPGYSPTARLDYSHSLSGGGFFKSAVVEDFTTLAQFKREIHAMHVEHARNFFKEVQNPLTVEELQRAIEKKDERGAYVLLENGALVGYAFTKVVEIRSNPTILDQKLLFIEDMFVEQESRRKGHGRRLMKELQQIAAHSGCGSIALDVWEWNTEAIAFYKSLGLQPTLIRMKLWIQRQRDTSKTNGTICSN